MVSLSSYIFNKIPLQKIHIHPYLIYSSHLVCLLTTFTALGDITKVTNELFKTIKKTISLV